MERENHLTCQLENKNSKRMPFGGKKAFLASSFLATLGVIAASCNLANSEKTTSQLEPTQTPTSTMVDGCPTQPLEDVTGPNGKLDGWITRDDAKEIYGQQILVDNALFSDVSPPTGPDLRVDDFDLKAVQRAVGTSPANPQDQEDVYRYSPILDINADGEITSGNPKKLDDTEIVQMHLGETISQCFGLKDPGELSAGGYEAQRLEVGIKLQPEFVTDDENKLREQIQEMLDPLNLEVISLNIRRDPITITVNTANVTPNPDDLDKITNQILTQYPDTIAYAEKLTQAGGPL